MKTCTVEGCESGAHCKGYCTMHYQRVKKTGTPAPRVRPTAEDRFWAKVEKTDGCWNWTAGKFIYGYGSFGYNRKTVRAHRFSWELANGPAPEGMDLDHICHNRACVNPEHLRLTTRKENNENLSGPPSTNTSGHLGVVWHKGAKKWMARVVHNRHGHYVGVFEDLEEAAEAAKAKRLELFTHNELDRRVA